MAKRKIGDVVADGVLDTELAVVRAARQAVQAVKRVNASAPSGGSSIAGAARPSGPIASTSRWTMSSTSRIGWLAVW
jgi:hypothetical protein